MHPNKGLKDRWASMYVDIESWAYEEALKNRKKYGKAQVGPILSKILGRIPEMRQDVPKAREIAMKAVERANEAPESALVGITIPKKKSERRLPRLDPPVITRFAPEPSGYPHLGHAKAALYSYWLAKENGGRFVLRFDDTNPKKESGEYVEAIKDGLQWLGISWDKETYTSDYMSMLYSRAEELIAQGKAYVCSCSKEEIGIQRREGRACPHRERTVEENLRAWEEMFDADEGSMVLRYKGDPSSPNTVMRDPTLFRIIDYPHFRHGTKYRVWPSYDFAVAVVDSLEGITYALRSKEYELRDQLYHQLQSDLGLRHVNIIEFSRLKVKGWPIGKRYLRPLVEEGVVYGWDDPRMPTLAGLRRRGIHPKAIQRFILNQGLQKKEGTAEIELLLAENRKVLDPIAPRRFWVANPVEIRVETPGGTVALPNHPSQNMGTRHIKYGQRFYVPAEALQYEKFRLLDLFTVKKTDDGTYKVVPQGSEPKFEWVPVEIGQPVKVVEINPLYVGDELNPLSWSFKRGIAEPLDDVKDWVQFVRVGFAKRLDKRTFVRCG